MRRSRTSTRVPSPSASSKVERAVPPLDQLACDREAEPRALALRRPSRGRSARSLARARRVRCPARDRAPPARAIVPRAVLDVDLDRPGRVRDRVVDQVVEDLVEIVRTRRAPRPARHRRPRRPWRLPVRARSRHRSTARAAAARQFGVRLTLPSSISRAIIEQALHDLGETIDLLARPPRAAWPRDRRWSRRSRTPGGASCRSAGSAAGATRSRRTRVAPAPCARRRSAISSNDPPAPASRSRLPTAPALDARSPRPSRRADPASRVSGRASDPASANASVKPATSPAARHDDDRERGAPYVALDLLDVARDPDRPRPAAPRR